VSQLNQQALQVAIDNVSTQGVNAHRAIIETYLDALPTAPSLETIKAELQTALAYSGYGPSSQWAAKHGSRLFSDMAEAAALIRAQSKALKLITEMDGDQPARSAWDMVRIARAALGGAA